ncbi:deazaflavin-dependent oxidoreductase (nitroreductase family) [Kitasatospora sp. GP30]|uniref:SDR family NAD(P)-dependent oxidoreductase n=1 Tax=Kitasatospora sp. GP30 TaxID=3035084 RepID=UPI000C712D76|nr:SDR family NAD(P)-dependent oxidoreductase [Kitasatospora sp. GP30]MDH6145547.1 deazaflavin-dependent oxidoreductase (nitroreductase family) [Kitasatospora sp. GP30]
MPAPTSARPARQGPWLHGKVALVTGGAGGIGLALSRALAAHGASVHAADNSPTNLARATQQLSAQSPAPGTITFHELDVSDHPAVKQWIADTHQEHGRIDILINNAAYIRWADVEETTVEEAERTMRVGYDAMVHTIKTVLPLMQDSRSGHIVNIGSSAGKVFVKGPSAAYAAMKAAVEGYTRILQLELSGTPVHAMLVRPGVVVGTDFFHHHVPPSRLPRLADFLPTTSPEQVAHAVLTGLRQGRPHVDIPGYLPTLYRAYALAPGIFSHLSSALGNAQGDYTTPRTPPRRSAPRPAGRLSGARRLLAAAGAQPAFVDAMAAITPPLDRAIHTLTAGRSTLFSALLPTLMLQTTGRKTGQPRRTPLLYATEPTGDLLVVASNFGHPRHPAWSTNLIAHPHATVTRDGRATPVTGHLLTGDDRDHAWQQLLTVWPAYATYAHRSGRPLRIFRLSPNHTT